MKKAILILIFLSCLSFQKNSYTFRNGKKISVTRVFSKDGFHIMQVNVWRDTTIDYFLRYRVAVTSSGTIAYTYLYRMSEIDGAWQAFTDSSNGFRFFRTFIDTSFHNGWLAKPLFYDTLTEENKDLLRYGIVSTQLDTFGPDIMRPIDSIKGLIKLK